MGHLPGVALDLNWLGRAAVALGRPEEGVLLAGAASRLRETPGGGLTMPDWVWDIEEPQDAARSLLDDAHIDGPGLGAGR